MKKYLITAAMAVAVSGTFVSCHDDEITGSTVEQKIQAFEDVFTQAFGKPDPNHTWGFGDPIVMEGVVTRSVNVNGNEWETRPEVTAEEAQAIYNWVNKLKSEIPEESYDEVSPVNLKNFFVTHVWGSQDNVNDENCYYTDYDGGEVYGGPHMNHLQISKSADRLGQNGVASVNATQSNPGGNAINSNWDHANNFNSAQNRDWDGNTMFVNWGTQNFAYHSSKDSRYHDKWIIVDGYYITEDHKYAGRYYVCFDFIATNPNIKTKFRAFVPGNNEGEVLERGPYEFDGAYTLESAIAAGLKVTVEGTEYTISDQTIKRNVNGEIIDQPMFVLEGYVGGNKQVDANEYYTDWIVRLVEAQRKQAPTAPDVKLVAESEGTIKRSIFTGEKVVKSGRVFCEDIVSNQYKFEDLDYNDVVFDAATVHNYRKLVSTYLDKDGNLDTSVEPNPVVNYAFTDIDGQENGYSEYYTKVRVLAGGGTLPIEIRVGSEFNSDLHTLFNGTPTTTMINTLFTTEREKVNMASVAPSMPAVDLKKTQGENKDKFSIANIDEDIMLNVEYGNVAATIKSKYYENDSRGEKELVASAKIMVPLGTPWPKERTNISNAYPKFQQWVNTEKNKISGEVATPFWNEPSSLDSLYIDSNVVGLDPDVWGESKFIVAERETELADVDRSLGESGMTPATNRVMATPGTNEIKLYDYTTTSGPGYLYTGSTITIPKTTTGYNNIKVGGKIRIYGVSIDDWEISSNCCDGSLTASSAEDFATNGYVDITVAHDMTYSDLTFSGKNFTITYVTVVGSGNTSEAIWSSTTYVSQNEITTAQLITNGMERNKPATIKITGTGFDWGGPGWGPIVVKDFNYTEKVRASSQSTPGLAQLDSNFYGSVSIPIESSIVNSLLESGGIRIEIGNFTYTNVEIFQ